MLFLPMVCSCTDFGQLLHHVSTHISTLALSVNCSCTDLDMSSSFDGLDCPTHVPYWWVNNPTFGEFCFTMIGRADIEGSKSNVTMNAWLPQATFTLLFHTRFLQTPHLTMSSARIDPPKRVLGPKERVVTPPPIHGVSKITLQVVVFHLHRSSQLFYTSQVISQSRTRVKLNRVFFPR
ncbi:unnamed protein product [Brassica rapa subsp. narinosa]